MNSLSAFFKQPYNSQGSALNWFLFLGLVLVCVVIWSHIMHYITADL